ncbi:hypothetical protein PFISCL1PPCAC_4791, partial [Pristionchus fissidentatus]
GRNEYWITVESLSDYEKEGNIRSSIRKLVRTEQIWQVGITAFRKYLKRYNQTWKDITQFRPKEKHSWWYKSYEVIPGDEWRNSKLAEYELQ